jgi:O-antigen ligase
MFHRGESADYEPLAPPPGSVNRAHPDGEPFPQHTARGYADGREADGRDANPPAAVSPARPKRLALKPGHALSYAGLFLFTIILYFRPYEYLSSGQWLASSASWTAILTLIIFFPSQLALEGNLTVRPREVNLVALLCVAGLLSVPFAISPQEAWDTFNDTFIKALLIFLVIVNVVRTERRLRGLFFLTLAVSCVISFNAVRDFAAGKVAVEGYRVAGSIGGMFGNPNDMALHLVTVLPIAVALAMSARSIIMKLVYWGVAALMVAGTTVTYSRGGFLGLIFVVAVLAWKFGRRNRIAVMLVLLVGGVLFMALAPGNYGLRLASIFVPGLDPNGSRGTRQDLLQRSIIVALRYPLFGVGMGNFHYRALQEQVSHNAYTQVAAEMGLTACVIYVKFLLSPLKRLRLIERLTLSPRKASPHYYIAVGLQASIVGYMVTSFFASVAYHWYVYYLIGYAVCFRRLYEAAAGVDVEEALASRKAERSKRGPAGRRANEPAADPVRVSHEY